jgi:hypothetical protein
MPKAIQMAGAAMDAVDTAERSATDALGETIGWTEPTEVVGSTLASEEASGRWIKRFS